MLFGTAYRVKVTLPASATGGGGGALKKALMLVAFGPVNPSWATITSGRKTSTVCPDIGWPVSPGRTAPKHAILMVAGLLIPNWPLTEAAKTWFGPTLPWGGIAASALETTAADEATTRLAPSIRSFRCIAVLLALERLASPSIDGCSRWCPFLMRND